jgi:hypothetical protein
MKAVDLELEKEDWFAIGQKRAKRCLKFNV